MVEGKDFVDANDYLMDQGDKGKLQRLLSDGSWKRFVAAANLSREEADALFSDLSQLKRLMAVGDQDKPSADGRHVESFMKEFPQVKQDLEEHKRKLYALAEEVDEVHRNCAIAKVAASSSGVLSGILTIAGVCLAPFTAGGSLVLSATGVGLGAAAAVTGATAGIVEYSKDASAKAEASRLVSTGSDTEVILAVVKHSTPQIDSLARKCNQSLQDIMKNARAFKVAKANPSLKARAKSFVRSGEISAKSEAKLQKAFGGTALAKTKEDRVNDLATAGIALIGDVFNLVEEAKRLQKGSKAQSAEELRQQAQELERRLEELTRIHESLQEAELERQRRCSTGPDPPTLTLFLTRSPILPPEERQGGCPLGDAGSLAMRAEARGHFP
ncbi:hypothetical protein QTO34_017975 [Cnephaeus nilssonii]|uniref:Apolipoprotein L3 n=1 Tax=Cnephaeus nilssonii TaxID=3371016 RepID=A0AA40I225_CNENI|nr:hypothetical protein QTO34_017975 [Eptesicus nilssonii]